MTSTLRQLRSNQRIPQLRLRSFATRPPHTPVAQKATSDPALKQAELASHAAPARWQRAAQASGFVGSIFAGTYAVLFYDFGKQEHCFMPIRRQFQALTEQFLTVSEEDRKLMPSKATATTLVADDGTQKQRLV